MQELRRAAGGGGSVGGGLSGSTKIGGKRMRVRVRRFLNGESVQNAGRTNERHLITVCGVAKLQLWYSVPGVTANDRGL